MAQPYFQLAVLVASFAVVAWLQRKLQFANERETQLAIQNYLLGPDDLEQSKKPILWIYVPHEYNARKWKSFFSRSSYELNQPYLLLTLKSILAKCQADFTICIVDDSSFERLLPAFTIPLGKLGGRLHDHMQMVAMLQLLQKYGGMICPLSFLCFESLLPLWQQHASTSFFTCNPSYYERNENAFVKFDFCGSQRNDPLLKTVLSELAIVFSQDFTEHLQFSKRFQELKVPGVCGKKVGTFDKEGNELFVDRWMSSQHVVLHPEAFGIWIPWRTLLKRSAYAWFPAQSKKEALESNAALSRYLLLTVGEQGDLEQMLADEKESNETNRWMKKRYVGFWNTPTHSPQWGLQPTHLGDRMRPQRSPPQV